MAGDEIGHEKLLLARRGGLTLKLLGKCLELLDRRLVHPPQHLGVGMFGGDFQQAAGVVAGNLADEGRAAQGKVHANARGHQRLLHARLPPRGLQQLDQRPVVGRQHAGKSTACRQLSRRHLSRISGREQFMPYMLAVGPPRSLIVPEKSGDSAMRPISARIDSGLRLWMMRPSWTVIEQNAQPPKQPRQI